VLKALAQRLLVAALAVGACALLAGCLSGNPSYFPYLIPGGPAIQTHPKPAGPGYFADFDPPACRIELRPEVSTAPVRGTQVFIATVYDGEGVPRRKRRVEWMIEGPGTIVEVDESGWLPGRGMKVDNKYAFSHTDYFEHCITRGTDDPADDFTIGPGQTWCVVTSAVEGQTTVIAYVPAIADWNHNRAYAVVNWADANLQFPPPVTVRAGGEYTFATKVTKADHAGPPFRIRYRIIDGPPAALSSTRGAPVDSVTEAVTVVGEDGTARVSISQPAAAVGTNRIAIEVIKPNPDDPGRFTVVSTGQTKITWQGPQVGVNINAPKTVALNQEVAVTYAVSNLGKVETEPVTLNATVPDGMELARTEPRAVVDGNTLIWTLPAVAPGKRQVVEAIYKPFQLGAATLAADIRTRDGLSSRGSAPVNVTEAKLLLRIDGPKSAVAGESLPFRLTVTNAGDGPADKIRVHAQVDDGLDTAGKPGRREETIESLAAGQSKTITLPISANRSGKLVVQAGAASAGGQVAIPQTATVEVHEATLSVSAHGPPRAYIGQEVTWQLVVRNTGEVPLGNVAVRAALPKEVRFVKATDGGRMVGGQVVWDLATAPARQERTVAVTVVCDRLADRAALSATVAASPVVEREGTVRTVSLVKPVGSDRTAEAALEIIGIPALQLSVKDADDPIAAGRRTTYTIRVKNAGTLAAARVEVSADVPSQLKPVRATGPGGPGKIDGQRITFPAVPSLATNAESTFVVEVEGLIPGDARFRAEVRSVLLAQPLRAEEPTRVMGKEPRPGNQ
jgi:uncharacterized repeat protein (TIGR01451 family)